jgi:signal peptide peptidase SppA
MPRWIIPFLFLAVTLYALVGVYKLARAGEAPGGKPDIIEVIEIGEINEFAAKSVTEQVEKINETPKIKGVLLIVNSPGGGASASAVIYRELGKIKVPVVGYCEYMCASGGVYALMSPSVKFIGVRDDSIGGSVGVIMQLTRFNRLLDWAKIDNETFKSGVLKDSGSPTRAMTDSDRLYLQGIVDSLALKFYGVVQKARPKVDLAEVRQAKKVKDISGAKNAYTRDELAKFVKHASDAASMKPTLSPASMDGGGGVSWLGHIDYAMELLKEIRSGESVKFQYLMPYRF